MKLRSLPSLVITALMVTTFAFDAGAQNYPTKPVRIVVPTAPGGGSDTQARLLARRFQETLGGQRFVIDNRPGASGIIGAEIVAKSPADGHTLLMASALLATAPSLYRKIPFDPLKDLAPISQISFAPQFLIAHPSVPAKSIREFVGLLKQHSGKLNAGSSGTGSANHLALEMLQRAAGFQVAHIPYKSGAYAMTALVGGEIDFMFTGAVTGIPQIRSGKVRPLAVTSVKRSSLYPDVPTLDSLFPGYESANWYAMFAPAGTPSAIVNQLSTETAKALKAKDIREFIAGEGAEPVGSSPEELGTFLRREIERYAKVIAAANVKVE
jgi:tripartite-type tricarboxylate transporter receptor subunit TctC